MYLREYSIRARLLFIKGEIMENQSELYKMRHSFAHIMANAIQHLWPEVKFGVGPVVENGFYYDIDLPGKTLSEDDFMTIETEMKKIISANEPFEQFNLSIDDAVKWAQDL
jgi:threonyl-tRNA synthetase